MRLFSTNRQTVLMRRRAQVVGSLVVAAVCFGLAYASEDDLSDRGLISLICLLSLIQTIVNYVDEGYKHTFEEEEEFRNYENLMCESMSKPPQPLRGTKSPSGGEVLDNAEVEEQTEEQVRPLLISSPGDAKEDLRRIISFLEGQPHEPGDNIAKVIAQLAECESLPWE